MRIAVVYHLPNPGGLTRFTHALLEGLQAVDSELRIDYFVSDRLLALGRVPPLDRSGQVRLIPLSDPAVVDSDVDGRNRVVRWADLKLYRHPRLHRSARAAHRTARSWVARLRTGSPLKHWYEFALPESVRLALASYDVVYFPFPYYIEPAPIDAPVVATFHDMNHQHFPENFAESSRMELDRQLSYWTSRADVVAVSTRFIEQDLMAYYPAAAGRCQVIYVPPYSRRARDESAEAECLERHGLRALRYLMYPANHSHHKNLVGLLGAADTMKREGRLEYPFVVTGFGTEKLGTRTSRVLSGADDLLGRSSLVLGEDVRALGFVSDEDVDALTRNARLVVSTSLYEAGCGPALDAWQFGVPVAFSDIPPFREQLEALGVEAWLFDPRDPRDIARILTQALRRWSTTQAMAERSKAAIAGHTWERAAKEYLDAFDDAIARHGAGKAAKA